METNEKDQKLMGILCYLGILWIIPMLTDHKNDEFIKFHINQGILVTILVAISWVVSWIPVIGWIPGIAAFIFAILGIINVVGLQQKELPLIGGIKIYK